MKVLDDTGVDEKENEERSSVRECVSEKGYVKVKETLKFHSLL